MKDEHTRTEDIGEAQGLLRAAHRIVVLTGAGISTDSGIPDFRGPNGVWTKNPGAEKLSNIEHYVNDPEVRRAAWARRLAGGAQPEPNAGHRALVALESWGTLDTLITQNIDGLHVAAGSDPQRVIEIHGTSRDVVCIGPAATGATHGCGYRAAMEVALERVRSGDLDPACDHCGGILKSATISFGQGLVAADLARADAAARHCDLILAVGTTLTVYPIANVVPMAKSHGAPVIIVNGGPTEMDDLADVRLEGSISELLTAMIVD